MVRQTRSKRILDKATVYALGGAYDGRKKRGWAKENHNNFTAPKLESEKDVTAGSDSDSRQLTRSYCIYGYFHDTARDSAVEPLSNEAETVEWKVAAGRRRQTTRHFLGNVGNAYQDLQRYLSSLLHTNRLHSPQPRASPTTKAADSELSFSPSTWRLTQAKSLHT
ncbi:hypothetical protein M8818_002322 [Zalaria obscura]|uniref:Uncharacterized protein n=1 Tax=Zalaria obscura TaxID=2024903 RepID=A0ACC3SI24_9PEZI